MYLRVNIFGWKINMKPEIDFFDYEVYEDKNHIAIEFNDIFELRYIIQTNRFLNPFILRKIKKDGTVDERLFLECNNEDFVISYKDVKKRCNYMFRRHWETIIETNENNKLVLC